MGVITRDRASRELTGTKYSKNVQKLRRENELLRDANMPLSELEAAKKPAAAPPGADGPPAKDAPDPVETDEDEDEERLPN
jgi:hypothetical protein